MASEDPSPEPWSLLGGLGEALQAVGDLLAAGGEQVSLIVVGGVAIILRGILSRATADVDVIAVKPDEGSAEGQIADPNPLPPALREASETVARAYGLSTNWINAVVGHQWRHGPSGMPPGLMDEVEWHVTGGLRLGVPGRQALVALKLYAAADHGPGSVHLADLLAFRPSPDELARAREWIVTQDVSPDFATILDRVIDHVVHR